MPELLKPHQLLPNLPAPNLQTMTYQANLVYIENFVFAIHCVSFQTDKS